MKSKTYTIAWDKCLDNCLDISSQLSSGGFHYVFYNVSKTDVDLPGWIRADDVRYYGHFYNSLKDFKDSDYDVFIFNAGDAYYSGYAEFTKKTENLFKLDSTVGAYAPSIDVDAFSNFELARSKNHPDMYLTCMTNGIYLALSKEVALMMLSYLDWAFDNGHIKHTEMKSGWGLDIVYCSIAIYLGKKIYRDDIVFTHPEGSIYGAEAGSEYDRVVKSFLEYCPQIGFSPESIRLIQDNMIKSVVAAPLDKPKIVDFYSKIPEGLKL